MNVMTRICVLVLTAAFLAMPFNPHSSIAYAARPAATQKSALQMGPQTADDANVPKSADKSRQTPGSTDPRVEQIRRAVRHIAIGGKITVFLKNRDVLHGAVTAIDADKFQVAEVDLHQIFIVEYEDVKKVRSGYGGFNLYTGNRTSWPPWVKAIGLSVPIGMLAAVFIVLATTKD
jgi:hypothetical protein